MNTTTTKTPSAEYLRQIVLDSNRDLPLHAQLRTALERLILEHFENDAQFYSESQLVGNLRVSQGTIRRALADLAGRGLLEKKQARCTIVRKPEQGNSVRYVAVFVPDYTSSSVATYLSLLTAACQSRNIEVQPIYTHRDEHLLKAYDSLRFGPREGGIVLIENSPRATTELVVALQDKGYDPVVVGTLIKEPSHKFVGGCNRSMITIGLEHLTGLGHRRIALLVNEPEEKESVQERISAFEEWTAASPLSLEARVVHLGKHLWDDASQIAHEDLEKILLSPDRPTAIFAVSDVGALGMMRWLQQRNIRVPADVSVMGIGDIKSGRMVHPTLTSLRGPAENIVEGIISLIFDTSGASRRLIFKPVLVVRESTAPPP